MFISKGITTEGRGGTINPNSFAVATRSCIFRNVELLIVDIVSKYYYNLNIKSNLVSKIVHKAISKIDVIYIMWPLKIPKAGRRKIEDLLLYIICMHLDLGHSQVKIGINSLLVT